MPLTKQTDDFYLQQQEPNKSCLLAMRHLLLQQDSAVSETVKYGMPCFCYHQKMFAYLWIDKKTQEPYLLMVEGNYLDNPALEKANRSRMKLLRISPSKDLPLKKITSILQQAIDLYRKGIIPIKR